MATSTNNTNGLSALEYKKIQAVMSDKVMWAQIFVTTYDASLKKHTPWTARWYQAEMLRDPSLKKVARCGRRTGKTETMCIDMLHNATTKNNFRCLVITPYENQVRLIFTRLKELLESSPMLNAMKIKMTSSPYNISFNNDSCILGFTTGAASGSGASSVRGQRADALYLDEMDYMADNDFDTISTIAAERPDITVFMSSTPTGARKKFYECCTNKSLGYKEFHFPSSCNPNWGPEMEAEFRSSLSAQGYIHEIEAEFGDEEAGVFNKDDLDIAMRHEYYTYNPLDYIQEDKCKRDKVYPNMYVYSKENRAPFNMYRCMGVNEIAHMPRIAGNGLEPDILSVIITGVIIIRIAQSAAKHL